VQNPKFLSLADASFKEMAKIHGIWEIIKKAFDDQCLRKEY